MHHYNFLHGVSHQDNLKNHGECRHKATALFLCTVLLNVTTLCYAGERRTEAIHIKADEMHFDLQSNSSLYKGNVTIKQGSIELSGDHVEIEQSNNTISRIIASGSPARFRQSDEGGKNMQAQSRHIKYFADEDKLVMTEDAKLIQNEQVIESDHISYDTKNKALLAGQPPEESEQPDSRQRVKMTLTPNTEK